MTQSSKSTLSQQQFDETERELEAAKAGRAEVEAKIKAAAATRAESAAKRDKAQAEVSAAKARHKVALANHGQTAALLNYAKVPAPFDGIVTTRKVDTNHFVQPPTGGRGEPLFVVARIDPVRVFVDVPETDAGFVKDGDAGRIRVRALQGQEFTGKVTRNAWALDYSPSKVARTLRTEIDLPNPDGKLRPGMYANVTLVLTRDNALTLPASAVITQGDKAFCFRIVDGQPVKTAVQVGLSEGNTIEVMRMLVKPDVWEEFTGAEEIVANAASVPETR